MSISTEFKQYGEIAAEQGKLALAGVRQTVLAAVGASDVVVTRAAAQGKQLATRTQDIATGRVAPTDVRKVVGGYLQTAGEQAVNFYVQLSKRGEEVVHEFRKDPRLQRVIFRAERAVDTVEDLLVEVASGADSGVSDAKDAVADGADKTRATIRKTAARNTSARKSSIRKPPARKATTGKAATSKAATSKAATSKAATSKAATNKATTSKA